MRIKPQEIGTQNRVKILDFLRKYSSQCFCEQEIRQQLGLGRGVVHSHCRNLIRMNQVEETTKSRTDKQGNLIAYRAILSD